jgi:hypothetical protein
VGKVCPLDERPVVGPGAGAAVVVVLVACHAFASGSGAGTGGLKVVTEFQPPAGGQIELIATTFRGASPGARHRLIPCRGDAAGGRSAAHVRAALR